MRIGIDCRQIYDKKQNKGAGIPRYTFSLVRHLLRCDKENDYILFFDANISEETIDRLKLDGDFKVVKIKNSVPFFSVHLIFTLKLWSEWLNWCIFPTGSMPFFYVGKSILVVHDLIIYNHPEWFPNKQWFSKLFVVPTSVAKATKIIAISDTTRYELHDLWKHVREKRSKVIYPGISKGKEYSAENTNKVLRKFHATHLYVFFVGTIEPRKNLVRIMLAFQKYLHETQSNLSLLLAGAVGWKTKEIFACIEKINQEFGRKVVNYIGKITDHERNILMQNAKLFIFPTLYEGFGLPVLEAMQNKAPVLTSNLAATGELVNDQAVLVDPENIDSIFEGIKKILQDEEYRKHLVLSGFELSSKFSWQGCAKKVLNFIKEKKCNNDKNLIDKS